MGMTRKYWKGLEELKETPEFIKHKEQEFPNQQTIEEFLSDDKLSETSTARRDFLKLATGVTAAMAFPIKASNDNYGRAWDKEFDILKPKKNAKGNRMFTPEDVKNLQLIYHLVKERGFTLEGAKKELKKKQEPVETTTNNVDAVISRLEWIKSQLLMLKKEL